MVLVSEEFNCCTSSEQRRQQRDSISMEPIPNTESNLEIFLKLLIELCKGLGQRIKRIFYYITYDLGGNQIFDTCVRWCVQHPQMAICLLAAGLVTSLPILLFVGFALSTIVMALTGFLVLEGTLLTIVTMVMLGLFGALGVVLLFCALVAVATYFGVSHLYDVYGSTEVQRRNLKRVVQRSYQYLISVPEAAGTSFRTGEENLH